MLYVIKGLGGKHLSILQNTMLVHDAHTTFFADGEIETQIKHNVRNHDVYIVQSTHKPVNDHLMELMLVTDAARRSAASRITAVIPYFGYARQDRKEMPRVPISARVVATMLESAGIDRVITVDIHTTQIQGFFRIPVDNLPTTRLFFTDIVETPRTNKMIVSPDAGGVKRARNLADALSLPVAIIEKRRWKANDSTVMNVIGDVKDRDCIIVDDMIDTGGTIIKGAQALIEAGALSVEVYATHAVCSNNAIQKLHDCGYIRKVVFTNTIPIPTESLSGIPDTFIKQLDVSNILSRTIESTANGLSVSSLFV